MAYAAITSLMRTIQQSMQVTGLFLQVFYEELESLRAIMDKPRNVPCDLEALKILEGQIAELAYRAEDMVDSESRNVFLAENAKKQRRAFWKLYSLVKQAVRRIDSKMKKWIVIQKRYTNNNKDLKAQNLILASSSQRAIEPENMMIGHENEFEMMQDQLSRGTSELEVVSIVGMGGIGKTTLAKKLYSDPFIMSHFDIRAKATVSQEYCAKNVLLGLLSSTSGKTDEFHEHQDDGQLADRLQKCLKGRRYLVVIDDIWTEGAWDDIRLCFPDCNCGSRILLTTRNMEVAEYASSGKPPNQMRLLNFNESWKLLLRRVSIKNCFPPEFEQIGKQIAQKCGGLPLAIIVIAGLLSKIGEVLDEWISVAENVSSMVSTDLEVQCMRVLALSYHHLPHHLKPRFLYFAIFPEDELIFVDKLVELWIAEGFLKAEEMRSTEELAEKCLKELIDRSLIFTHLLSFDGKIKICGMHDVTRELCLREARNMNFVNVIGEKNGGNTCAQSMHFSSKSRCRISIHNGEELARYCNSRAHSIFQFHRYQELTLKLLRFKLVRVLDLSLMRCNTFPREIFDLIHLRYLALALSPVLNSREKETPSSIDIPPLVSSLCYLQTFILNLIRPSARRHPCPFTLPLEILMIPQLRLLCLDWNYLRFHEPTDKILVLKYLQCLDGWNPRYCTGSIFRLFPNVKKLIISGIPEDFRSYKDLYDFRYLDQLEELEFRLSYDYPYYNCFLESNTSSGATPRFTSRRRSAPPLSPADALPPLLLPPPDAFPLNVKNITFDGTSLQWKDLSIVGKLPKLEALKLAYRACIGKEWEVVEEGFPHLKFLLLKDLGIRYWIASSDHFPCLERLFLEGCRLLDSIPQDFADINTLALIDISDSSISVENSAKQIQQDIQENYASSVEVHIH